MIGALRFDYWHRTPLIERGAVLVAGWNSPRPRAYLGLVAQIRPWASGREGGLLYPPFARIQAPPDMEKEKIILLARFPELWDLHPEHWTPCLKRAARVLLSRYRA